MLRVVQVETFNVKHLTQKINHSSHYLLKYQVSTLQSVLLRDRSS